MYLSPYKYRWSEFHSTRGLMYCFIYVFGFQTTKPKHKHQTKNTNQHDNTNEQTREGSEYFNPDECIYMSWPDTMPHTFELDPSEIN